MTHGRADRARQRSRHPTWFRWALFLALMGVLYALFGRRSSGPDRDASAPDVDLPIVAPRSAPKEGNAAPSRFHLAAERGKPVVVEVFASWCGECRRSAPVLAEAAKTPRAAPVRFIGVSVDDSSELARRAAAAWQLPYDVALDDGSLSSSWNVKLLPTLVVIDAAGRVRRTTVGHVSSKELESMLADLGAKSTVD